MKSVLYEQLVNDLRNIAATRGLEVGDVTNISDAAWLIESMQSRIAELEKDAARYRWLKNKGRCNDFCVEQEKSGWVTTHSSNSLDAAIDTAMQKD